MSPVMSLLIRDARGERRISRTELPLEIGAGTDSDIQLPGLHSGDALAFLGLDGDSLYIQPARAGVPLFQNERLLEESSWLRDGDVLRIESVRVHCEITDQRVALRVEESSIEPAVSSSKIVPPPVPADSIEPVIFEPRRALPASEEPRGRAARIAIAVTFAVLALSAFFLFTARSVKIAVQPEPDQLDVHSLGAVKIGERFLMQPGTYSFRAERKEYAPLETEIEVGNAQNQEFVFSLERLPGRLAIATDPEVRAAVSVNGEQAGFSPLEVELTEGQYPIRVEASRYLPFQADVSIEGGGHLQELLVELEPDWARISIASSPPGARFLVDGVNLGSTPVTAEISRGTREFSLHLEGHKTWREGVEIEANHHRNFEIVALVVADATLSLDTVPSRASITVDGEFRGLSPLDLELTPDEEHEIAATRLGYTRSTQRVSMNSGEQEKSTLRLVARKGEIRVRTNPADAELFVNGRAHRSRTLQLPARPQRIEARKPGYETVATTIQPLPGFALEIDLALPEGGQATVSAPESAPIAKKSGAQFIRFGPGRFTMGASRREQGRRSNETLHEVEFTRPFVMASHEVTNREFNAFDPQHSSGLLGGKVLNSPDQPVVNVSWDQAAAYANWLSEREGLPAVYELRGERYVSRDPIPTGYRLPTEAEWERVARSAGRSEPTRFPWGSSMPPAAESGNFADETARDVAPRTLTLYQDGYPVSAPVGSFLPNPAGIYDLGGNVREWTHDLYSIGGLPGDSLTVDPSGASSGRYHAVRGSSWRDASITRLRFTFRDYADQPLPDLGFRLARYPE